MIIAAKFNHMSSYIEIKRKGSYIKIKTKSSYTSKLKQRVHAQNILQCLIRTI